MAKYCKKIGNYYTISLLLFGSVISGGFYVSEVRAAEPTLTITLSSADVSTNVVPFADATGTFVQSSPITVGIATDNYTGYTVGIKANNNTYPNRLINTTDNSYLSSISTATNLATFKATDLSSIATAGGNQGVWGYLPSKLNSLANTNFLPSPGTAGNTIDETHDANLTAINYTISLGAKVSPLATLGAYTNGFTITSVANPIPYTISFSENKASGMPDNILDGSSGSTTVTLPSNTPSMDGFQFIGWCDQATTKSGDTDTCASGHQFQPGGTLNLDAQANTNNIKLYAMWAEICAGYTAMQGMTSSTASTLLPNVGSTATVCDLRDNTKYTIGKLADNKYWMLENLSLDITAVSLNDLKGTSVKPNTNASNTSLSYLKNGGGDTSDQYATAGVTKAWTNYKYSYSAPMIAVDSSTSGPCEDAYCVNDPSSGQWSSASITQQTINGVTSLSQGKIGVYYNYCAASAGSYCYGNGYSSGTPSGNATEDICPAGWRLPTGGVGGEFGNLYTTGYDGDVTNLQTALRTPLSGTFNRGNANNQGNYTLFWSSTRDTSNSSNTSMYILSVGSSNVGPYNVSVRYTGSPVRCLLSS